MPVLVTPHLLRDDCFIDCDEPEAFALEDILLDVRAQETPDAQPFSCASDYDLVVWAVGTLCESPLARAFACDARFEDWAIELDDCEDDRHIIDGQMRVLILPRFQPSAAALGRSPHDRMQFLVELCRGLRAIWRQNTGVRHGFDLTIPHQILWQRLREADGDLMTLLLAWELREAGLPELWRHLIGSDLGSLGIAFSATLERSPDGVETALLLRKLFLQWMEQDDLLTAADRRTLSRLDPSLGLASAGRLYGTDRLASEDVRLMAALPDDAGYLDTLASLVLSDDFFARMPDIINQTHLEHILSDLAARSMARAGFRDQSLAEKFFPDLAVADKVDILS